MKKVWLDEQECSGCGACVNICPVNAISLKDNKYGYLMPKISENCIDCNKCEDLCMKRKLFYNQEYNIKYYAAWSKSDKLREQSTSGGIFSELAKEVLFQRGYVFGAAYDKSNLVEHICIDREEQLDLIRRSKYIQSNTKYNYRKIKELLLDNKVVLFCGSPCQVIGLKAFLGKNYSNLVTVDFICRGINSNKAYKKWLEEIEIENKGAISDVRFKYKKNGWKKSPLCTKITFHNGNEIVIEGEKNLFMKGYLGPNLYIRPSCSRCDFKDKNRTSDITLADFWGIPESFDDDKGTSLMMIRSEKGESLVHRIQLKINMYELDETESIKGNICYKNSVNVTFLNKLFLNRIDKKRFSYVIKRYMILWKIVNSVSRIGKCLKKFCLEFTETV